MNPASIRGPSVVTSPSPVVAPGSIEVAPIVPPSAGPVSAPASTPPVVEVALTPLVSVSGPVVLGSPDGGARKSQPGAAMAKRPARVAFRILYKYQNIRDL